MVLESLTYLLWHVWTDKHAGQLFHKGLLGHLFVEGRPTFVHQNIDCTQGKVHSLHLLRLQLGQQGRCDCFSTTINTNEIS